MYIGIDTSNYTTSVSVVEEDNVHNVRKILEVKEGERGIRQSDAVFIHLKTLPKLYSELADKLDLRKVKAVGVSTKPRNVDGSYMPVFVAGESFANVISDTLGVPCYTFSHQDGHIMAGVFSCGVDELLEEQFLAVHLSGGTTEILKCEYENFGFKQEIVGATSDISAGQFIDRVGVGMGIKFPCGARLEELSEEADKAYPLPVSVNGTYMSFSGVETKVQGLIGKESKPSLALGVFECVAKSLIKAINNAISETGIDKVLIVGGVASNKIIGDALSKSVKGRIYIASREFSTDNAVGIGLLTRKKYSD